MRKIRLNLDTFVKDDTRIDQDFIDKLIHIIEKEIQGTINITNYKDGEKLGFYKAIFEVKFVGLDNIENEDISNLNKMLDDEVVDKEEKKIESEEDSICPFCFVSTRTVEGVCEKCKQVKKIL